MGASFFFSFAPDSILNPKIFKILISFHFVRPVCLSVRSADIPVLRDPFLSHFRFSAEALINSPSSLPVVSGVPLKLQRR